MTTRPKPHTLTALETRILNELAKGGDYTTAGARIGVSRSAVGHAVDRARRRMGATSTVHLLALAITAGFIDPDVADRTAVPR